MVGVPAQLRVAVGAEPAPDRGLGADDRAAASEPLRVVGVRVGSGDRGIQVREIPLNRSDADGFEVDEQRLPIDRDEVAAVW